MISSEEDLRKRGLITENDIIKFQNQSNDELMLLVNSESAVERSVSVNLLSKRIDIENLDFVNLLLERLCVEKKLYTKIEICKVLEKGNIKTAEQMVKYLGKIGKNQYKYLPEKVSMKKSYPLPRDIIARTLGKMDIEVLPTLFNVLKGDDIQKISEVIDAIGFLLFYNPTYDSEYSFKLIIDVLNRYSENRLITWKCVTCLSSFKKEESFNILKQILRKHKNDIIIEEAKRSIRLIESNLLN